MAQLPSTTSAFITAMAKEHVPATETSLGQSFLKFNGKSGQWTLGKEDEPVDGEEMLINIEQLQHGWIRWGESPPAKVFAPVVEPLPERLPSMPGTDSRGQPCTNVAKAARGFTARFFDDELGQAEFSTSSDGGCERVDELKVAIIQKYQADGESHIYPRVKLGNDWYKRNDGNKVFKPIFELVAWCDQNGEAEGAAPEKIEAPEEEPAPARRRRRRA